MRRDERGQATTELALVLPLIAVLLLLLAQVGLVLRDQLVLTHVAREAARAAVRRFAAGALGLTVAAEENT